MVKELYIIAGANGSGKSTIASVLLSERGIPFVNPDDIARELCPSNLAKARIAAGRLALARTAEFIGRGVSFAIESTLSGRTYLKLLKEAKASGYVVTIAYVFVDSPLVCVKRIGVRVRAGGHYVPDEDVFRRYARSKGNFVNAYRDLADHWLLYYNGGTDLQLVAHGNGTEYVLDPVRNKEFMEGVCLK